MQLQAYKGYFENSQSLHTDDKVIDIPAMYNVTVIIEERQAQDTILSDEERINKKRAILQSLKGILPPDVDLETARAERIAKRGLMV